MASGSVERKIFSITKSCSGSYSISSGGNAQVTKTAIGNDMDSDLYYGCIKGFSAGAANDRAVSYVNTATSSDDAYSMRIENVGTSTANRTAGILMSQLPKKYVKEV